jgi:hypothetical protein
MPISAILTPVCKNKTPIAIWERGKFYGIPPRPGHANNRNILPALTWGARCGYKTFVNLAPGVFVVADLNARGELQSKGEYRYDLLEQIPGAPELIGRLSGLLWQSPEGFEGALTEHGSPLTLRWRASSPSAGIATLRGDGELVSVSLLCSGIELEQDKVTLFALQQHLLRELHDTGYEPAFELMDLHERPLAATINFEIELEPSDQHLAALADRCFAASYFRYHGLA